MWLLLPTGPVSLYSLALGVGHIATAVARGSARRVDGDSEGGIHALAALVMSAGAHSRVGYDIQSDRSMSGSV